jgi:hypothetical protein
MMIIIIIIIIIEPHKCIILFNSVFCYVIVV